MNEGRLKILVGMLLLVVAGLALERFGAFGGTGDGATAPPAAPAPPPMRTFASLNLVEVQGIVPATPVGEKLAWGLSFLNTGGGDNAELQVREMFAPPVLDRIGAEALTRALRDLSNRGPYGLVGHLQPPTETAVRVAVRVPVVGYVAIKVEVEAEPPHRLLEFQVDEQF
jgi:hypothetical protein